MGEVTVDGSAPSGPAVTVSPMRRRHLRAVLAIETEIYPRPWSSRLFEDELERGGRAYLVARIGPTLVGYAGVLMIADDAHVATVAIDPGWQRQGIATRLLAELVRRAIMMGANQMTLEVRMSNVRAQEIYRRFGFVPAGARKGYYSDNGEDALVMWAHEITGEDYAARLAVIDQAQIPPTSRHGFDAPVRVGAASGPVHPVVDRAKMDRP